MSRAQAWYDERKRELAAIARSNAYGSGPSDPTFGNPAGWLGGLGGATFSGEGGGVTGVSVPQGMAPTDADVQRYIQSLGGNPYSGRPREQRGLAPGRSTSSRLGQLEKAAGARGKKDAESDLQKFFREAQEKIEEANTANETRYQDILTRLTDRYDRVMGQVSKFGGAAREDLEERAREGLGSIQANLSARGLGNSTIMAAFQQRSDRDLAREQQRLSETIAQREMEWDAKLSGDTAAFMERKTDAAPDYGMLMNLANKYGTAGRGGAGTAVQGPTQQEGYQQEMPYNPSAYAGANLAGVGRPRWDRYQGNPYAGIGIQQPFSWGGIQSNWQSDPEPRVEPTVAKKEAPKEIELPPPSGVNEAMSPAYTPEYQYDPLPTAGYTPDYGMGDDVSEYVAAYDIESNARPGQGGVPFSEAKLAALDSNLGVSPMGGFDSWVSEVPAYYSGGDAHLPNAVQWQRAKKRRTAEAAAKRGGIKHKIYDWAFGG